MCVWCVLIFSAALGRATAVCIPLVYMRLMLGKSPSKPPDVVMQRLSSNRAVRLNYTRALGLASVLFTEHLIVSL